MKRIICLILSVVLSILIIIGLNTLHSCVKTETPKVTYEIIDKTTEIDSYYNWFTDKQVIETVKIMVLKNTKTGYTFSHKSDDNTFYRFKKGDKISVEGGYFEDKSIKTMKYIENGVEIWAKEVESCKKRQLTKRESEAYLSANFNEKQINENKEIKQHIEGNRSIASMVYNRTKSPACSFTLNPTVILLCEMLSHGRPGTVTMLIAYIQYIAHKKSIKEFDVTTFCREIFPFGVPDEKEWQRLWDLQKLDSGDLKKIRDANPMSSDNGLDYILTYKSICDNEKEN